MFRKLEPEPTKILAQETDIYLQRDPELVRVINNIQFETVLRF